MIVLDDFTAGIIVVGAIIMWLLMMGLMATYLFFGTRKKGKDEK